MAEIGIVIVTYFSEAEIGPCLDAVLGAGADVVVVDNGSRAGTVAGVARRGVRLIANMANLGFAAAVNQGVTVLESAYVLLLNPDAVLQGGLERLREACDLPGAAGAGGRLLDPGGGRGRGRLDQGRGGGRPPGPRGGGGAAARSRRAAAGRFHGASATDSGRPDF